MATLLVLDLLWINGVTKKPYSDMVRRVQGGREMRLRLAPGVVAYALMVVGLRVFVLTGARDESIARGLVFGAVLYGVYHGTVMAFFEDLDGGLAVMDVVWGSVVYGVAAWSAFL